MDARLAEPGADCLIDDALEPAAMDGELRDVVAGIEPTRLAPDLLPEPIGVKQFVGADRDSVQALKQTELGQFLDGVRARVGVKAQAPDGVLLLENLSR